MRPAGRGLLIADLIGSTYFTSVIFIYILKLKAMFYYFCHLPQLDKTLNSKHAIYFALLMSLKINIDFFYLNGITDMVFMLLHRALWNLYNVHSPTNALFFKLGKT